MSESETVAKNRIEFQWGSKLQGTSSEALVVTSSMVRQKDPAWKITKYVHVRTLTKRKIQASIEICTVYTYLSMVYNGTLHWLKTCALSLSSESYILRLDLYFFLIPTLLIRRKLPSLLMRKL